MNFDEIYIDLTDLQWDTSLLNKKRTKHKVIDDEEIQTKSDSIKPQVKKVKFKDNATKEQDNLKKIKNSLKLKDYGLEDYYSSTIADFSFLDDTIDIKKKTKNDDEVISKNGKEVVKSIRRESNNINEKLSKSTNAFVNGFKNSFPSPAGNSAELYNKVKLLNNNKHFLPNKKEDKGAHFLKPESSKANVPDKSYKNTLSFLKDLSHLELSNISLYCDSLGDSDNKYLQFYKDSFDNVLKEHLFIDSHTRANFLKGYFNNKKSCNKYSFFINQSVAAIVEKNADYPELNLWKVMLSDNTEIYLPYKVLHKKINSQDTLPKYFEKLFNY
jgi:hypothetical protein